MKIAVIISSDIRFGRGPANRICGQPLRLLTPYFLVFRHDDAFVALRGRLPVQHIPLC